MPAPEALILRRSSKYSSTAAFSLLLLPGIVLTAARGRIQENCSSRRRPVALDRVQHRHPRRFEVPGVPGYHRQAVLQRSSSDEQVGPSVSEGRCELPPPACHGEVHRQDPLAVPAQHPVQSAGQVFGERRVASALLGDATFDLSYRDHAQMQVDSSLCVHPPHHVGLPFAPPER